MSFKTRFLHPPDPDIPKMCDDCPHDKFKKCEFMNRYNGKPCPELQAEWDKQLEEDIKMYDQMAEDLKKMEEKDIGR